MAKVSAQSMMMLTRVTLFPPLRFSDFLVLFGLLDVLRDSLLPTSLVSEDCGTSDSIYDRNWDRNVKCQPIVKQLRVQDAPFSMKICLRES